MGTGIVSILLYNLPWNARWLYWISVTIFCLNIFLFVLFTIISVVRYTTFPGLFSAMLGHPVQSLFLGRFNRAAQITFVLTTCLGTIPMGFATIVNMTVFVCVPAWGPWAATLAWTLWWIDVVISVATCMFLPFIIMHKHDTRLEHMTAAWLLPIVSTIVAAASGGIVAQVLSNPQHALWTLITSYILWGTGVPLAMVVLVMYFHRLTVHKLPPREVIVSVFLPLGPLGQGGFAIMQLGKVAMDIFPKTNSLVLGSGETLYTVGFGVALVMWGYGLVWLFFALATISRTRFPFNMGWWGFTFPLGVFAVSTVTISKELPSLFFKVLGTIFSLLVVLLWIGVSVGTARGALVTGKLLFAPCAAAYEKAFNLKEAEKEAEKKNSRKRSSAV
jgi:tellurite resistance protein TehA-like permease